MIKKHIASVKIPICLVLSVLMLFGAGVSTLADGGREDRQLFNYLNAIEVPEQPDIAAEGAYVIELNTGAVLYRKNSNERFYPASITKILTALITIEHCEDLDEQVTFSKKAIHDLEDGGYSYIAEPGDKLSVRDCLYGLMLMSSNECAYALAEHVGGSISGFAAMMNEKAEEIGCTNSHFANPHGLTNSEHVTTPHDMARIMWAAVQNPIFLEIDSTVTYRTAPTTSNPDGYFCTMRHMMMRNTEYHDDRVKAGKTGYISAARNTLVTYAADKDMELIIVVMRTDGSEQACKDTKALMNYAFKKFETRTVELSVEAAAVEQKVSEKYGRVMQSYSFDPEITAVLPKESSVFFDKEIVLDEELSDDIAAGKVVYSLGGVELGSLPLEVTLAPLPTTQAEEITQARSDDPLATAVLTEKNGIYFPLLIICAAVLVLVLVIVIFAAISKRSKRRAQMEEEYIRGSGRGGSRRRR